MNHLLIPMGGSALRMLGLPKFLLPFKSNKTLLEFHIELALNAGISRISLILRHDHYLLVSSVLGESIKNMNIIILEEPTKTMCETLLKFVDSEFYDEEDDYVICLPDTIYIGDDVESAYRDLVSSFEANSLLLFQMREDQKGKLGQVFLNPSTNQVLDIVDKNMNCEYKEIWGMCRISGRLLRTVEIMDAHVGISVSGWLNSGHLFYGVKTNLKYYDCGTFEEYSEYIIHSKNLNYRLM
jgi:NDP-sugar pyrophosphorylase family protein